MAQEKEKQIDQLNFKNFRSFLPQPIKESSSLIKEFKIKRQQERS